MDGSAILEALEFENRAHPFEPKLLVGPDVNYGRELLAALARRTGGWIGWEATSLRRIAGEMAFVPLHAANVVAAGDVEIRVLINRALDRAIDTGAVGNDFAMLGRSLGFRQALLDSILELRIGGISADDLHAATAGGSPAREVAVVMREYDAMLAASGKTDSAGVFRSALDHFDQEAGYCLPGQLLLAPGLVEHGLPRELLDRLIAFGARVLQGDVAIDARPPGGSVSVRTDIALGSTVRSQSSVSSSGHSILAWMTSSAIPADGGADLDEKMVRADMFVAAAPADELREVFRRIIAEGLCWDQVEIVAADVDAYGVALDVLCQRLGVGATLLHGIPLVRTRLGRILERWFAWLDDGLPADLLREALEAGEIGAGDNIESAVLAAELRECRIGWGRARYESATGELDDDVLGRRFSQGDDEPDDEYQARLELRRLGASALRALLVTILGFTPRVPERGDRTVVMSSVSELAKATLAWLGLVRLHGAAEEQTLGRVQQRLSALTENDYGDATFGVALATLRDALSDVRAWPRLAGDAKPWSAGGGMVHLTDLVHAGTTGRSRVFVVGLDSDATGGFFRQDSLMPDSVRAALPAGAMSTVAERRHERSFMIGSAFASLRGRVTLSYATNGSANGDESGPAPELLQLHRAMCGSNSLSYADLRKDLGEPVAAIPVTGTDSGAALLDARDAWLDALSDGPLLLNGVALVRECFPSLNTGLDAFRAADSPVLTQYGGLVPRAAGQFDPRRTSGRPVSASYLEQLASCPLSWFYHYGLSLRAPQDPDYDPDAWLDSAQRGSLLHQVFEEFATRFAHRRDELATSAADDAMTTILDGAVTRWIAAVPPPGESVRDREIEELRGAASSFLAMERQALASGDTGTWRYMEYAFGGGDKPASYRLSDGSMLTVSGRVDRIDVMADGSLRVIDYKAGSVAKYRKTANKGKFNGGRQLQPAIYASALDGLLDASVGRFEYRFPTGRGHNQSVVYGIAELADATPIVTQLLEHLRDGAFIPTNVASDCKYCNARPICRVDEDRYHKITSPRASWARDNAESIEQYRGMLARRAKEPRG